MGGKMTITFTQSYGGKTVFSLSVAQDPNTHTQALVTVVDDGVLPQNPVFVISEVDFTQPQATINTQVSAAIGSMFSAFTCFVGATVQVG
jgi:acetylornithine/succinyldiaminopimelate/putrescine aminotransferase